MSETWKHQWMPGLVVHPAGLQEKNYLDRILPQNNEDPPPLLFHPMMRAALAWENSEDDLFGVPVGFPMWPGVVSAPPFDLNVHPWIGSFPLMAMGRGTQAPHSIPAFVVQVKMFWNLLASYTTGKITGKLFDLTIGPVDTLWEVAANQANEKVEARLQKGIAS